MGRRMSLEKVKVGLLGYGLAGRLFHAPLLAAAPEFQLKTIWSTRVAEIQALDPDISIADCAEDVLTDEEISVVVVATPTATHASLAERALLAGKHVVVDKPVALTVRDAGRLVNVSKAQHRRLFAFHNRRWDSDFIAVQEAISNDRIGNVTHFESHLCRFRPIVVDRWREDGSLGSGVWFDLGPHIVDQVLLLFGRPIAVTADLACLRAGAKADDWAHVVLHYPDRRAILHASLLSPDGKSGGQPRFFASGTKGSLIKRCPDVQEQQLDAGLRPCDSAFGIDNDDLQLYLPGLPVERLRVPVGRQQTFYELVSQCILHGTEEPVGLSHLLEVCEIIEVAKQSAAELRTIEMPITLTRPSALSAVTHAA